MTSVALIPAVAFGWCISLLFYDLGVNLLKWRLPKSLADPAEAELPGFWGRSLARMVRFLKPRGDMAPQVEEIALSLAFQLKAGANVYHAIAEVARQGRGMAYSALARAVDLYRTGLPIGDALTEALLEPGSRELGYLLSVLDMGLRTGGNIPLLLARAAEACRRKRSFKKEAAAKLAESRLTAILVSTLPWLIFVITWKVQPEMLLKLFSQPVGRALATISLLMWGLGVVIVALLVRSIWPGESGLDPAGAGRTRGLSRLAQKGGK